MVSVMHSCQHLKENKVAWDFIFVLEHHKIACTQSILPAQATARWDTRRDLFRGDGCYGSGWTVWLNDCKCLSVLGSTNSYHTHT